MGRLNAMSAIVLLSVTASASTGLSNQASLHEGVTRTVFVSVVDRSGVPVTDLSADDFVIKEGGKDREIVGANMTTMPLRIAIVVDDNGTGIFRYALGKFVERLQGRAEFALSTVQGQHLRLLDYTTNLERLLAAINQLNTMVQSQSVMIATNQLMFVVALAFAVAALAIWLAPKPTRTVEAGAGGH